MRTASLVATVAFLAFLGVTFADTGDKGGGGGGEGQTFPGEPCGGEPVESNPQTYGSAPKMTLEPDVDYQAVIETSCGELTVDLLEDEAPVNVNNFVFLAREGFYTGLKFHRVELNSIVEAGDPNHRLDDPPDDPGYTVRDELPERSREYVYGVMGMANEGVPDTGGSRFFFIVHDYDGALEGSPEPAGYTPDFTILGRVPEDSWDTLQRIAKVPIHAGNDPAQAVRPIDPVYIESIEILER